MENINLIIIGKRSNLSNIIAKNNKNYKLIESKNIENLEFLIKNMDKVNIIYNSSFKSHLLNSTNTDPIDYSKYSFHYLSKFIKICERYHEKIIRIIFTSSCSVYGENEYASENDEIKISNLYSSLKISSEYMLKKYLGDKNINLIFARLFNMYGGNDQFSVISKIIFSIKNRKPFLLSNNGENIRDFIHIDDVASIYKLILNSDLKGVINISSGMGIAIKDIVKLTEEISQKKLIIKNQEKNEVKICVGSNKIITKNLNFTKFKSLREFLVKINSN